MLLTRHATVHQNVTTVDAVASHTAEAPEIDKGEPRVDVSHLPMSTETFAVVDTVLGSTYKVYGREDCAK